MSDKKRRAGHDRLSTGDQAEDWIDLWATQAGLIVNSARRDRAGWDQVFDLCRPHASNERSPLTSANGRLSGRFQVKSSRGKGRRASIKLSNWRYAIEDALPWFFLFVRIDTTTHEPVEVAAIHLGKELIERAMRRIYSVPAAAQHRLHKIRLPISWAEKDVLRAPYPQALLELINRTAPEGVLAYAAQKKVWHETVGYSTPRVAQARFVVSGSSEEELLERVSRAAIGLEEQIEISALHVEHERFGQFHPDPALPERSSAQLSIGATPADDGFHLNIVDRHGSRVVELPVRYLSSAAAIPELPERYWLSRAQSRYLDIVGHHATGAFKVHFRFPMDGEPILAKDLSAAMDFMKALDQRSPQPVRLELAKDGRSSVFGAMSTSLTLDDQVLKLATELKNVCSLAKQLDVTSDFQISFEEIHLYAERADLMLAARLNQRRHSLIEMTLAGATVSDGDRVAVLADPSVLLDSTVFIEVVAMMGRVECVGGDNLHVRIVGDELTSIRSLRYGSRQVGAYQFASIVEEAEPRLLLAGIKQVFTYPYELPPGLGEANAARRSSDDSGA